MSTGPRIPFSKALQLSEWIASKWRMTEERGCLAVGSLRRKRADIGDLDFIAPLPKDPEQDELHDTIAQSLGIAPKRAPLFTPATSSPMKGRIVKGLNPGFKSLTLMLTGASGAEMQVNIERYHPGPQGNRGWKEMMRTGPDNFGEAILTQWKWVCRTAGTSAPGSVNGFWVNEHGIQVATPTELHAFHMARCLWVRPELRSVDTLCCFDWMHPQAAPEHRLRLDKAMNAMGLVHREQVAEAWDDQRLALAGWKE